MEDLEFHEVVRDRLYIIMAVTMRHATASSLWQRVVSALRGYWATQNLFKTLEAAESMLMQIHSVKGVHEMIRREWHNTEDQYRWHLDVSESSQAAVTAKVKLMNLLIMMMFAAIPTWVPERSGWNPECSEAARAMEDFVQAEVPAEVQNK